MTLYEKIVQAPEKIRWRDILSDCYKKHTRQDIDYAFIAGTAVDQVNESNMLMKWQRPWLFYRAGIAAVALILLMLGLQLVLTLTIGYAGTYAYIYSLIVPLLVPVVLMLFFWEMNVPRNLSVIDLCVSFLVGAAVCFFGTFMMSMVFPEMYVDLDFLMPGLTEHLMLNGISLELASSAALREEPGKLLAVVLILAIWGRKSGKKIYGFTGLAVGAAVGAAFSGYESIVYALNYGADIVLLRAGLAVAGHVLFCAPYGAALALHMENGKIRLKSFLNRDFLTAFIVSVLMHAIWNSDIAEYLFLLIVIPGKEDVLMDSVRYIAGMPHDPAVEGAINLVSDTWLLRLFFVTLGLWSSSLWIVRKCFAQVGKMIPKSTMTAGYHILGLSGVFSGKQFSIKSSEVFIGTDGSCQLCFPLGTPGVSGQNSKLLQKNGALYLGDLGAAGGTWINGNQVPSGKGHLLKQGDIFQIGTLNESFRLL